MAARPLLRRSARRLRSRSRSGGCLSCRCLCRRAGAAAFCSLPAGATGSFVLQLGEPDVEDRVLHGVKAGAVGEHPAGKDALDLSVELDLVNLDEGGGVRRLGWRPGVADPRRHFQRAELHRLIDRNFQMRDAPRHLVERGEHGDRVLDRFGTRSGSRQAPRQRRQDRTAERVRPAQPASDRCIMPSTF